MVWEPVETILAALLSISLVLVALLVVTVKDLVYASLLLAVLGALTASFVALLGYYLVAAFIIIVYVGAAVMFIIITVSMLGGGGLESRDHLKGAVVASLSLVVLLAVFLSYFRVPEVGLPLYVDVAGLIDRVVVEYIPVIAIILVALAATIIEAIAVARRG